MILILILIIIWVLLLYIKKCTVETLGMKQFNTKSIRIKLNVDIIKDDFGNIISFNDFNYIGTFILNDIEYAPEKYIIDAETMYLYIFMTTEFFKKFNKASASTLQIFKPYPKYPFRYNNIVYDENKSFGELIPDTTLTFERKNISTRIMKDNKPSLELPVPDTVSNWEIKTHWKFPNRSIAQSFNVTQPPIIAL